MENSPSNNGWQRSGDHDHGDQPPLLEKKQVTISLRQWLDDTKRVADKIECSHIFMQIVKIVSLAHSKGFVAHNVRPSCFVMSSLNHVSFIESPSCSDSSGSENSCQEYGVTNSQTSSFVSRKVHERVISESSVRQEPEHEQKQIKHVFPMKQILQMETEWYTSPEEAAGGESCCASDVYRLGVLLFEENLDEREAVIELEEKIAEQEMLLEFLLLLQQRKQEAAKYLHRNVSFLSSDLQEVSKLQASIRRKENSSSGNGASFSSNVHQNDELDSSGSRKRIKTPKENQESSRLMKNFKHLESAYFSTRHKAIKPVGRQLPRNRANHSEWISPFLEGLSKYMSFSKLKVKADLKQGDILNSSNLVCSLSFDREGEFFATAGVNKKIKVFEYDSILNENQDIHFPLVEILAGSKLSSLCWNPYIKSQIASSNFEGVVQLWDVTQNQVSVTMREHERRVWSVDFAADPKLLASGSDDASVKLWNINQGASVSTIRTRANVCCVQFLSDSSNYLAFGSADHKVYYYDLRNTSIPLCTFVGHEKTVSYIKFIDSTTLVSSSTDNTLKLWDLSGTTSQVLGPLQSFTGHVNLKNFVGLSVSEGYIATGSETNEVFIYHKAFPMPALSYKFNTIDPISGNEVDDNEQFISSVCWRSQSSTLVAANSTGNIKVLEME
uniref:protein SPA1-RELATED 3-like isoform X2 n=1 Tax=Erigeron canadensis TaxID=72917 RepID=UPI001CB92A79|nr:protein SPA1-RELATED 3-like isoform X2 [Erigeron canadensis]